MTNRSRKRLPLTSKKPFVSETPIEQIEEIQEESKQEFLGLGEDVKEEEKKDDEEIK